MGKTAVPFPLLFGRENSMMSVRRTRGGKTMDTQLLMRTAMLAGEILLRSGAETYRVEDTMHHILKTAERIEDVEILVIMTGISATLKVEGEEATTYIKRVEDSSTNMSHVVNVNDISRRYCGGDLTLSEAYEALKGLDGASEFARREYNLAAAGICVGFAIFFGGNLWDVGAALVVGAFLAFCLSASRDLKLHAFIQDIFAAFGVAVMSIFMQVILGSRMNMDTVMISSIMPLVPGVAITNAVRDTLRGDYLSGTARILEAFLRAAGIAVGIGIGLAVFGNLVNGGGILS